MRILVAHASAHGSTAEIAERIAARLRARGNEVAVAAVESGPPVEDFDAVVLGSAIHDRAWLPSATAFVTENARALAARPTWLFSVGMVDALPRPLRKWAATEGSQVIAPFLASIRPRGAELFSGVVREEDLPRVGRALLRLVGGRFGDFRDWASIDAWAYAIVDQLAVHAVAA